MGSARLLHRKAIIIATIAICVLVVSCTTTGKPPERLEDADLEASPKDTACGAYPCFSTAAEVLAFDPSTADPTVRATVPLAKRSSRSGPGMLLAPDMAGDSYSNATFGWPQGGTSGDVYNFKYWPYVDAVYYYYHAAFAVPPTVWTNAAHRNGVPIAGVMTGDCGGCGQALTTLFSDSNRTKTVDIMVKTLETYGFDGWFLDFEAGFRWSSSVKNAIDDLRSRTLTNGRHPMVVTYQAGVGGINDSTWPIFQASGHFQGDYAPSGNPGPLPDQTYAYLEAKGASDQRFNTYWGRNVWMNSDPAFVCGRASSANAIYNGNIGGTRGYGPCLDTQTIFRILNQVKHSGGDPDFYQSLAFFAPQWTRYGGQPRGVSLDKARAPHQQADYDLWVGYDTMYRGSNCAQSNPEANAVSSLVTPLTPELSLPFATSFNTGEGTFFAIGGQTVASKPSGWTNLSAQDIAPTWLCYGDAGQLSADYDYSDAYDGGTSLRLKGPLQANQPATVNLFSTAMQLPSQPAATAAVKTDADVNVTLRLEVAGEDPIRIPLATSTSWSAAVVDASAAAGKVITRIGIEVTTNVPKRRVSVSIGHLALYDATRHAAPAPITVTPDQSDTITWTYADPGDIAYANVFAVDGSCNRFVGRAFTTTYRLNQHPLFDPPVGANAYMVQPVSTSGAQGVLNPAPCSS